MGARGIAEKLVEDWMAEGSDRPDRSCDALDTDTLVQRIERALIEAKRHGQEVAGDKGTSGGFRAF